MIEVDTNVCGNPKGPIRGNPFCWLGCLEYTIKDAKPGVKLITYYNKREKVFGTKPVGVKENKRANKKPREVVTTQKLFSHYCQLAGVIRAESVNNMWARKSFANTTLGELQMPAPTVMAITGHKSEQTLRNFYLR